MNKSIKKICLIIIGLFLFMPICWGPICRKDLLIETIKNNIDSKGNYQIIYEEIHDQPERSLFIPDENKINAIFYLLTLNFNEINRDQLHDLIRRLFSKMMSYCKKETKDKKKKRLREKKKNEQKKKKKRDLQQKKDVGDVKKSNNSDKKYAYLLKEPGDIIEKSPFNNRQEMFELIINLVHKNKMQDKLTIPKVSDDINSLLEMSETNGRNIFKVYELVNPEKSKNALKVSLQSFVNDADSSNLEKGLNFLDFAEKKKKAQKLFFYFMNNYNKQNTYKKVKGIKIIETLIAAGADVNSPETITEKAKPIYPLLFCINCGDLDLAKFLLDNGAGEQEIEGKTYLGYIIEKFRIATNSNQQKKCKESIRLLLEDPQIKIDYKKDGNVLTWIFKQNYADLLLSFLTKICDIENTKFSVLIESENDPKSLSSYVNKELAVPEIAKNLGKKDILKEVLQKIKESSNSTRIDSESEVNTTNTSPSFLSKKWKNTTTAKKGLVIATFATLLIIIVKTIHRSSSRKKAQLKISRFFGLPSKKRLSEKEITAIIDELLKNLSAKDIKIVKERLSES